MDHSFSKEPVPVSRRSEFFFWGFAVLVLFLFLGHNALSGSEDRWAEIAREMAISGDWLHPSLNWKIYFDKPLLTYWLILPFALLYGGFNEFIVRIPSALAGLAGLWGILLLGRKLFDRRTALLAGWMLLSYRAEAYASSFEPGFEPELAVDENIRTWWAAADGDPRPEWRLQLEKTVELRAIQINFAEHQCLLSGEESPSGCPRFIVETSAEGEPWQLLWDQSENVEDKTHCYYELPFPGQVRRLRIKITAMGNHGRAALSGVRLFGLSKDVPPEIPSKIRIERRKDDPTIADIRWEMPPGASGWC